MSYFALTKRPAKAAEIADALGLPRSSTDQLLKTLVMDGYLLRSGSTKTYLPSPLMAEFGTFVKQLYPDHGTLTGLVEALYESTGELVSIAMVNDCHMQLITVCPRAGEGLVEPNFRVPILGSAIGGAALTLRTRAEIEQIVIRAKRQRASYDPTISTESVLDNVQSFRMKGYSWQSREGGRYHAGFGADRMWHSVAIALPERSFPDLVVGLSGPVHRIQAQEHDLVNRMRHVIRQHLRGDRPKPRFSGAAIEQQIVKSPQQQRNGGGPPPGMS